MKSRVLEARFPEAGEKAGLAPAGPKMGRLDHRQLADTY